MGRPGAAIPDRAGMRLAAGPVQDVRVSYAGLSGKASLRPVDLHGDEVELGATAAEIEHAGRFPERDRERRQVRHGLDGAGRAALLNEGLKHRGPSIMRGPISKTGARTASR